MAQVAFLVRITPEDPDKVDELLEAIRKQLSPKGISKEELAFGIKAVKALFYVEESEGSAIEEKIAKIPNVGNVDVLSVDRLG
ncbi:MAG: hypothetical protein QXU54_03725 [Candidatus Micrarchaeia archaeon]